MVRLPRSILVGSTGRNCGKTEFVCRLIAELSERYPVHALKVTTIDDDSAEDVDAGWNRADFARAGEIHEEGEGDHRFRRGWRVVEEQNSTGRKDTSRMLRAGARRVWRLLVRAEDMTDAAKELPDLLPQNGILVMESNGLRRGCEPDLFFMVRPDYPEKTKRSAESVFRWVDRFVIANRDGFDFPAGDVALVDTGSVEASAAGDGPAGDAGPGSSASGNFIPGGRCLARLEAASIVLAGGLSTRMGEDKRYLPIGEEALVNHVVRQLDLMFQEVILSVDRRLPEVSAEVRQVPDRYGRTGPLGGVVSAMEESHHDVNLIAACDIPVISRDLVQKMLRKARDFDVVVPVHENGRPEPLFAVYRRSTLPILRELLDRGELRIRMIYDRVRTARIPLPPGVSLTNINTRQDYEAFLV